MSITPILATGRRRLDPFLRRARMLWEVASGWVRRHWQAFRQGPLARLKVSGGRTLNSLWRRRGIWLVLLPIVTVAVLAVSAYHLTLSPARPGSTESEIVVVPYGYSTSQIARLLDSKGLIRSATAFRLWAVLSGTSGRMRAGEYSVSYGLSSSEIIDKLLRGQVVLHPVTIPEGYNIDQITALLEQRGFVDPERFHAALRNASDGGILPAGFVSSRPAVVRYPLEGYLFPDTYNLYRGITEQELVRVMVGRLKATFTPAFEDRARELGFTPAQVMTLASIIEREARVGEERTLISGVFHNRLRIGMALGADPTVRYAMPDPTRPITRTEMAIDSPYNTYVYAGLPPGPICSPGLASIEAALYPEETKFLYFVARPDGTHDFSRTLAEHERKRRIYIK